MNQLTQKKWLLDDELTLRKKINPYLNAKTESIKSGYKKAYRTLCDSGFDLLVWVVFYNLILLLITFLR